MPGTTSDILNNNHQHVEVLWATALVLSCQIRYTCIMTVLSWLDCQSARRATPIVPKSFYDTAQ
jgi:hypothetical protein